MPAAPAWQFITTEAYLCCCADCLYRRLLQAALRGRPGAAYVDIPSNVLMAPLPSNLVPTKVTMPRFGRRFEGITHGLRVLFRLVSHDAFQAISCSLPLRLRSFEPRLQALFTHALPAASQVIASVLGLQLHLAQQGDAELAGGQSLPPALAAALPFASRPSADAAAVSEAVDLLRGAQRCGYPDFDRRLGPGYGVDLGLAAAKPLPDSQTRVQWPSRHISGHAALACRCCSMTSG